MTVPTTPATAHRTTRRHRTQPRHDPATAHRIARSATTTGSAPHTADVLAWLQTRRKAHAFRVDRIPFAAMDDWTFQNGTGNLVHDSGRFFSVEGLRVTTPHHRQHQWHQPIIKQPEIGILGILVQEIDGVLHFLMQAKMEPGNRNLLQLSPTVQATRSNYTQAHHGTKVRYLEYFTDPSRGRVLADVLQSEHGSWFYRKSNRNMLVEAVGHVPEHDDFRWLTLGQIGELLRLDNVVNMDARTVLACAPTPDTQTTALHTDTELLSWITAQRARHDLRAERVPLAGLPGWEHHEDAIVHDSGRYFDVVAVAVKAASREVAHWTQPLFAPRGTGVTAFLTRTFAGIPHLLVHARLEAGFADTIELGPTVQYTPANYAHLPARERPPFLDDVLTAHPARIQYQAVHSEEGGRFLNAESRYLFLQAHDDNAPEGYRWATPGQLATLLRHNHYLNVQARTLLSCLTTNAVRL